MEVWSDGSLGLVLFGTLGTCACRWLRAVEGCSHVFLGRSEIFVLRCETCAILSNACVVVSPASRLIVVVEDGLVRMETISKAACIKKSYVFTYGNGTTLSMKVTLSTFLHILVCGK